MIKKISISLFIILIANSFTGLALAGPQSSTYEIKDYTFGGGGTGESGITGASNYTIFGTAAEIDASKLNGASNYSIGGGLTYTLQAGVPNAPAVTNPGTNYDRLKVVVDNTEESDNSPTAYGPYYPNSVSGAEETGIDWGPASDPSQPVSSLPAGDFFFNASNTAPLRVTFGGVSIPGGATITGMQVDVSRSADAPSSVYDWTGGHGARFLSDGTNSLTHLGSDLGDGASDWYNNTDVSYGGSNNDWGIGGSLTPSLVNDPNFAFELSAIDEGSTGITAYVDSIALTIYVAGSSPIPAPDDTTYAIAISSDNFASDTRYVQSDNTIGTSPVFQTYSVWGGSSGFWATGLANNTTYSVKVKARQGNFTESRYSAVASATTSNPSLTFSLDSNTLNFSNLNSGDSYTDSAKTTTLTTSTNAYNGYTIYGKEDQPLTSSVGTISDYGSPNSSPTTWSGTGFGYNTSDTNLGGSGGTSRFSGSKYAGFTQSPSTNGDPVADHAGPVTSPVSGEAFTVSYRVTANSTTKAGTYNNTIIYTIVPVY